MSLKHDHDCHSLDSLRSRLLIEVATLSSVLSEDMVTYAESLDHFVVPVDDLVAAEEFYTRVFGGQIVRRNGLNVRQRKRGAIPHTFIQIGGKRMGVYLQSENRPEETCARGLPTYSFTTSAEGMDQVMGELSDLKVPFEGPVEDSHEFASQSLFFMDPAGNHYNVYRPRSVSSDLPPAGSRMTAVGYLELEAPDIESSVKFYEDVLGFRLVEGHQRSNAQQATLLMASGQTLILTKAPFKPKGLVMSRTVPGPHIAFYVPVESWQKALARLDDLGIPNGDRGAAKERVPGGHAGTYMDDPAGYVIQYITDGME
jgi:catechol 2,3-dioxygenase-like lactoylglutathione lyase family enzyme